MIFNRTLKTASSENLMPFFLAEFPSKISIIHQSKFSFFTFS
ncbi:hypothetical protein SC1083_0854 [Aggregatibacter actinomycetemcomitans serotype e str. SC1083]|uniref:Uncharacterized protein n=1 Tax=Aggregatibacter actinomycetemcomitans serotype e str. SC1083 TaxID=907488 RepID=G4A7Q8_AGGAC|nr:hypothetical protein SC1083_0854 [Aggregatibacter actinomycetemcomitans serotype e str. SC1083]